MWMTRNARQMKKRKAIPDDTVNQGKKAKLEDPTTTSVPPQPVHHHTHPHQIATAPPQQLPQISAQCSQRPMQQQNSQPRTE
ncbi:hypothetical protein OSTOST_23985, partial [Ostertagia ostertagi]